MTTANGSVEVRVLLVHRVHDDEDRRLLLLEHLPDDFRADLDAVGRSNQEQRGIGHAQGAVDVAHEIRIARGVQQVDLVARPLELREAEVDRDLASHFVRGMVEHRGAIRDASETIRRLRIEEHGFGERCLANTVMGDERDVPDLRRGELFHTAPPDELRKTVRRWRVRRRSTDARRA